MPGHGDGRIMALLIPENLRSRRDVPPGANRLARVLESAFDDDATVWYEPLFDGSGERPDVVVLVPDAGVLVLEILEEKANAVKGVEGGKLAVAKGGVQGLVDDPLHRATAFARSLASRLDREWRISPAERLPVASAGVFTHLGRDEAAYKGIGGAVDLSRCVFRDDLDTALADRGGFRSLIERVMATPLRDVISAEAERAHRALIHPDTVIGSPMLPFPSATPAGELKVLDRQQEGLAKNLGSGHRIVRGVAGSGKTLVLTYRARLLAESFPGQRILISCFNKSLKGALDRQLKFPNVEVATIDSLIDRSRKAAHLPQESFADTELDQRAEGGLEALERKPDAIGRYDHILIDEAQDFPTPAIRFMVKLLREGSNSLLIVADAAQNIYSRKFRWKDAGVNAVGRTRILRNSYRNTREILEYAHDFLLRGGELRVDPDGAVDDETAVIPPELSTRSGPHPLLLYLESPQAEVLAIAGRCRELIDSGVAPGDIAVLYGKRFVNGFAWTDSLIKAFAAAKVPVFWATNPEAPSAKYQLGEHADRVVLSTIFSAKGLEFAHVIMCGYLDDRPPEQSVLNRRVIYVGMTRATQALVLTASGKHRFIADLER